MKPRLSHVAIAVRSIGEVLPFYTDVMGLGPAEIHDVPEQGVRVALLSVDEVAVELVEPLDQQGAVARFLERRGEGLHHICFEVEDLPEELARLSRLGVELINAYPQHTGTRKIAFLHPRWTHGVLIELEAREEGP